MIGNDPNDQCTVYLDEEQYRLLEGFLPLEAELERVLLGARLTDRGVRLAGAGVKLENLHGFVSFEANHEPQRRRQAHLDQICAQLERALQR